jgi:hypothetical protein
MRRITPVDHLLGVLADHAEPAAQVVVDIRRQVRDSIVQYPLPQRGLLQCVLSFLLATLEFFGESLTGIRIVERGQLGLDGQSQMFAAERTSASTWSRTRSFSRDSTFSLRNFTMAGKLDSKLSSLSLR